MSFPLTKDLGESDEWIYVWMNGRIYRWKSCVLQDIIAINVVAQWARLELRMVLNNATFWWENMICRSKANMETEEVRLHHPETLLSYKSHWGITARIYIRRRMPLVILPSHLSALFFIASFCSFYRLMEIFMDTWELNRAAPSARRLNGGFLVACYATL